MNTNFGPIAMLGSEEPSLAGGRIFEALAACVASPLHVGALETLAGFVLNSRHAAGKEAEYPRPTFLVERRLFVRHSHSG